MSLWDNLANIASAGISAAGAYLGSKAQSDAASQAASTVSQSSDAAIAQQERFFNQAMELGAPYRQAGYLALGDLGNYAQGMDPATAKLMAMDNGELYNYQRDQVTKDLNAQLAARGKYNSGTAIKALSDAYSGIAANESQDKWNRSLTLSNLLYGRELDLANLGAGSAASGSGIASNTGANVASTYSNLGNSLAGIQSDAGNARASMYSGVNGAVQGGLQNYYLSKLIGN